MRWKGARPRVRSSYCPRGAALESGGIWGGGNLGIGSAGGIVSMGLAGDDAHAALDLHATAPHNH